MCIDKSTNKVLYDEYSIHVYFTNSSYCKYNDNGLTWLETPWVVYMKMQRMMAKALKSKAKGKAKNKVKSKARV